MFGRTPPPSYSIRSRPDGSLELGLPSQLGAERPACDAVAAVARGTGFPKARVEDLSTAVGEATLNAMEHGNGLDPARTVRVLVIPTVSTLEPPQPGPGEDGTVRLRLANGGQVAPLLCRAGRAEELVPAGQRLPLGVLAEPAYCDLAVELLAGDVVILASDGLPEAPGPVGELFGFERLAASAARWAGHADSAQAVLKGMWADVEAWSGPSPEHDDMTLLVLRVPSTNGVHG